MSVVVALAAATHHRAPRRPKTARADATNDALRSRRNRAAGETELFSLYEDELGGVRPDRLHGVRPQSRDQQRTVKQATVSVALLCDARGQWRVFDRICGLKMPYFSVLLESRMLRRSRR